MQTGENSTVSVLYLPVGWNVACLFCRLMKTHKLHFALSLYSLSVYCFWNRARSSTRTCEPASAPFVNHLCDLTAHRKWRRLLLLLLHPSIPQCSRKELILELQLHSSFKKHTHAHTHTHFIKLPLIAVSILCPWKMAVNREHWE